MNHIQQSVQTNVSSTQYSAAPVRYEALLQEQISNYDLAKLDLALKRCDYRIKSLLKEKNGKYSAIEGLRDTRDKFYTRESPMINRGYLPNLVSESKTFQQIQKHKNSAAGFLYELTTSQSTKASQDLKNLGVVGIVATLGQVEYGNVSRLLSEFLGKKIMLAVVCDTIKSAKDLESRVTKDLIKKNTENHKLGESIGQTINEGLLVICLETLRPYVGEFIADDPQRRLDLPKPKLSNGEVPHGFLEFAVNMISVDERKLFSCTPSGYGLRETLFYHLFSHMQIYRSKEDMLKALPCIDIALSLDGWGAMRRNNDMITVGYKGHPDPDVVFPKYSGRPCPPVDYLLLEAQIKEKEMEQQVLLEELRNEYNFLESLKKAKSKFLSRENSIKFREQMSPSVQFQVPEAWQRYLDP